MGVDRYLRRKTIIAEINIRQKEYDGLLDDLRRLMTRLDQVVLEMSDLWTEKKNLEKEK